MTVLPIGEEKRSSKVPVANGEGAMIARGLGVTYPEVPLLPGGHYCWGIEKGRSFKAASSSRAAQGSDQKGTGAQEGSTTPGGSHTRYRDSTICVPMQCQGSMAHVPPFPACGTVRGPAEKNSREDQDRGQGWRPNHLQLGIKTEQVQRNETLICTAAAPGLYPLRVGPIKSWAEHGHGRPQGSARNSEK